MSDTSPGGPAAAPGWRPDPSGRAHARFWDGRAWTERVSNWGRPWTDPPGPNPHVPDLSMLSETALAFSYGAAGIESAGPWPIYDATGRRRGSVVIEGGGLLQRGPRRYLILDPADRIVLLVVPRGALVDVLDWTQRPHGVFDGYGGNRVVRFLCGNLCHGQAWATDGAGRRAPFVADQIDGYTLYLVDTAGAVFGSMTNREAQSGPTSFFGGPSPEPDQLLPVQSWFQLGHRADLPEPLRTFTLAFPLLYAHRVHLARSARRVYGADPLL